MTSYLSDRSQVTASPDGRFSAPVTRNRGVPQGRLCGQLFFSLFILNPPDILQHCKYLFYADDFTLHLSGLFKDITQIITRLNAYLVKIAHWVSRNGFVLNGFKTKAIWLGCNNFVSRLRCNSPSSILDGTSIEICDVVKILGVEIDSTLSWVPQTNITVRKSFAAFYLVYGNALTACRVIFN